jgi:hypothetical protein
MSKTFILATVAMVMAGSAPALAAQAAGTAPPSNERLPDGTTMAERANTARLNAQQAAKARAEIVTYDQEMAAVVQVQSEQHATFADETAAYEAEKARIAALGAEQRAEYEAAVAAWEADVAACKAGDQSRCAKPRPAVPMQR